MKNRIWGGIVLVTGILGLMLPGILQDFKVMEISDIVATKTMVQGIGLMMLGKWMIDSDKKE